MSWPERIWRTQQWLKHKRHSSAFSRGGAAAVYGSPPDYEPASTEAVWLLQRTHLQKVAGTLSPELRSGILDEADAVISGTFRWFTKDRELGRRPVWNTEPTSGFAFPQQWFGGIQTQSPDGGYDIKQLWELNHHGSFSALAKADLISGNPAYRARLIELWTDWMEQTPALTGPNYTAPISVGLRLLHWCAALRLLEAKSPLAPEFMEQVWKHLYFQREHIAAHPSKHSSANNHYLAELASLILIDSAFPNLSRDPRSIATKTP